MLILTTMTLAGPRQVVWSDGRLSGHPGLVLALQDAAERFTGVFLGPPEGPLRDRDHLSDPVSVLFLAERAFPLGFTASGDVPTSSAGADLR